MDNFRAGDGAGLVPRGSARARSQADLFVADLLGVPVSWLRGPRTYAARNPQAETAVADSPGPAGHQRPQRWRVVLRPGEAVAALRAGDLVVRRAAIGRDGWRIVRAEDIDPRSLCRPRSTRLRDDVVVLRPIPPGAGGAGEAEDRQPPRPPAQPPAQPPPPPQGASICAVDEAVSDTLALVRAGQSPMPVTAKERTRAAGIAGALDDYRSVAAVVPVSPDRRLLVFLHGDRDYVTMAKVGDVPAAIDPSRHSRVPRWADPTGRKVALTMKAVPLRYGFNALPAAQTALPPSEAFAGRDVKNPIVLAPADAEVSSGRSWNVPPKGQYGKGDDGKPQGPGTMRFYELLKECFEHLRCLAKPSGGTYLPSATSHLPSWLPNMRRIYVVGHSGGGKPLLEACGADMLLVSQTSRAGTDSRAVDLWLLDATYGWGTHNYVNFCRSWKAAGLLKNAPDGARFVCVYRPTDPASNSNTEPEADALRAELATLLGVPKPSLLALHDHASMTSESMVKRVVPALSTSPVVFIRTEVGHETIPTAFIPLLLRTAAS
jgi:hypothetical protein